MGQSDQPQNNQSIMGQQEQPNSSENKHFIEDGLFQQLLAIREEIYQATEINVSPRKLVNMLLKQADFKTLRDQLIQQYF